MAPSLKKLNILLVEDDEDDYLILEDILNEITYFSFDLQWVSSYEEAKKVIEKELHDIYLFDFYLGANTGLDLLSFLQEKKEDLPAILLTGNGDQSLVNKTLELGAYDYIEKTEVTANVLERSIRYAMKHSSTLSKLRTSEKQYRTVFEHSKELIFIANSDYNLVSISQAAEKYLGFSRDELYAMMSSQLFVNPMQIADMEELISKNGSITEYRITVKNKAGEKKEGLLSCVYESLENGDFYLHGVYSDITERLKAEKMSFLNQKNMATSRLMRTLAHEVRNPLTNIALSVESLEEELQDDALKPITEIIHRNTKRIDNLINEVLNTAKAKSFELKPQKLSEILLFAIRNVEDRLKIKNIDFSYNVPPEEPHVAANSQQLSIAFTNILVNAIEALENTLNPKINISLQVDEPTTVTIKDNGVGMNEEELSRLFEPFFTSKNNGIGLGLAATLGILQSHNVNIDVKSQPDQGCEFILSFPRV